MNQIEELDNKITCLNCLKYMKTSHPLKLEKQKSIDTLQSFNLKVNIILQKHVESKVNITIMNLI